MTARRCKNGNFSIDAERSITTLGGQQELAHNARLRPPGPKAIEQLVLAFATRRLGFRRQVHELL